MKPYMARKLPFEKEIDYNRIAKKLIAASSSVSKLDGMLEEENISRELFINPLTKKEAVLSSQIEGTQATLTEILELEADEGKTDSKNKYDDFIEITNYNKAIEYAENEVLDKGKISLWLLRNIHKLLLNGARGKDKNPGEFRNEQNWIGKPGSTIENASFVPVPQENLTEYLENLENYINDFEEQSELIQAAIIHVQFEKIHPFKDGNGRIGRMLIPLFLYYKGILSRPILYISEYFEENRDEYYDKLNAVLELHSGAGGIEFFLNAVETQANRNIEKFKKLQNLYGEYKGIISEILNTKNSIYVVDALFKIPVFKSTKLHEEISKSIDIDIGTVNRYIRKLVEAGVIVPEEGKDRYIKYYFKKLLDLIQWNKTHLWTLFIDKKQKKQKMHLI